MLGLPSDGLLVERDTLAVAPHCLLVRGSVRIKGAGFSQRSADIRNGRVWKQPYDNEPDNRTRRREQRAKRMRVDYDMPDTVAARLSSTVICCCALVAPAQALTTTIWSRPSIRVVTYVIFTLLETPVTVNLAAL